MSSSTKEGPKAAKGFVISEAQLAALQQFVASLKLSWAETDPYMQILRALPEVVVSEAPPGDKP